MSRAQQVSEMTEDSNKSEEECNLVVEDFGSCTEFEISTVQTNKPKRENILR